MSGLSFQFGTVGTPEATPNKPGGSVGTMLFLTELGLNALEIGWVRAVRVTEKTCAEIKATAEEHKVGISVHAPYFINFNADTEEWPKSRQRLMDAAYYGYLAGATEIVFHPGSYFGKEPAEVLPLVLERLQGCIDELRRNNNPVTLCPETMGKSAMIGSLDDVLEMSTRVEGVKPCLDFAHLHARPGDGSMNTYGEWLHLLERYAERLGAESLQNLHVHLSGIAYTHAGEKEHLPLLEADLDLKALFRALHQVNAGGKMLCESPRKIQEKDALLLKDLWLEISGEG
jgi:deoxyribonuclease-4